MIGAVGDDMFRDLTLTTLADGRRRYQHAVRITGRRNWHRPYPASMLPPPRTTSVIIPNANHRLSPDDVEASLDGAA